MTAPRVVASYKLTFGASLVAAAINGVFGLIVTWVLVRYRFPGRRLIDALVDLPFALPTAVAGIALTTLYAPNGWLGEPLGRLGIKAAFTPLGIMIALTFIGLPFVVRTLQPVLESLDPEVEEAAASLGAGRFETVRRVVMPSLMPAWLTGFALAFARALGEYGSVVFIAGNMPMKTEITPLIIITKLEQYDYARRDGDRHGDAGRVVRHPARRQPAAVVERAARHGGMAPSSAQPPHGHRAARRQAPAGRHGARVPRLVPGGAAGLGVHPGAARRG